MDYSRKFRVVLVQPEDGANVGAVCRAIKTMGLSRLSIVGGERLDPQRVERLAVHAYDIFINASHPVSLNEAVERSVLTAGFTRRTGKWRKYISYTPELFAEHTTTIAEGEVCLVFGNERTGLNDEDLKSCDCAVHIPTSPEFPSLNLSHAVQISLYVLYRSHAYPCVEQQTAASGDPFGEAETKSSRPKRNPVTRSFLEGSVADIISELKRIGFFSLTGEEDMSRFLRDIVARALMEKREVERLAAIFKKIADLKIHR